MLLAIDLDGIVRLVEVIGVYSALGYMLIRDIRDRKWWRSLPFLRHDITDVGRQILSFDTAILPKVATDENAVIYDVNAAAEVLFGWTEQELFGKNLSVLIPDPEKGKFTDMMAGLVGKKMEVKTHYYSVITKASRDVAVELIFRKDHIGDKSYYLFVFRDREKELKIIKKLEGIVEIQKIKLDILTKGEEIGGNGSWFWDLEKERLLVSPGYKYIIGETGRETEFEAQYLRDKVWRDDNDIVNEGLAKAHAGESYDIVYHLKRPDLKIAKINSIAHPIMSENGKKLIYVYGATHLIELMSLEDFYKI